jgi:hypothetical protein
MVSGVGPFCSLADRPLDDYEWEYGKFQPTSPSDPRTPALDSIPETDQQHDQPLEYPSQDQYTTAAPESAAVEEITHNFDQVRISSPASSFSSYTAPAYTPAAENTASFRYIKTRNPHTSQEEFDPRESLSRLDRSAFGGYFA